MKLDEVLKLGVFSIIADRASNVLDNGILKEAKSHNNLALSRDYENSVFTLSGDGEYHMSTGFHVPNDDKVSVSVHDCFSSEDRDDSVGSNDEEVMNGIVITIEYFSDDEIVRKGRILAIDDERNHVVDWLKKFENTFLSMVIFSGLGKVPNATKEDAKIDKDTQ